MNFPQCPAISVLNNSTALLDLYFYWFRLPEGSSVIRVRVVPPIVFSFHPRLCGRVQGLSPMNCM